MKEAKSMESAGADSKIEPQCPLCYANEISTFFEATEKVDRQLQLRRYFQCSVCEMIFLSRDQVLSRRDEKLRYDTHNNHIDDLHYVETLRRLWRPVKSRVEVSARGLDYGSGPNPVMAQLIRREGFEVDIYDPFYAPNGLDKRAHCNGAKYDFVLINEVIEHCRDVQKTLKEVVSHLKPAGLLALQTQLYEPSIDFRSWGYRKDPTHISLFTKKTMHHLIDLGKCLSAKIELECSKGGVWVFRVD